MRSFRSLLGLCLLLLLATGCGSTMRTTPDFKERMSSVREVASMPAEVQYFRRTATVTEPVPELDAEFAAVLSEALRNAFDETHMEFVPVLLSDSLLVADQALALELTRARESFGATADSLRATKQKEVDLHLNPEVGLFADLAESEADHLLFVRATGYGSSGGAVARDVAVAAISAVLFGGGALSQTKGVELELALIDADTADVLWYNRNTERDSNYDPLEVKSVQKLCTKLLRSIYGTRS